MSIREVQANLQRIRNRRNPPIPLPFSVSPTLRLVQLSAGPNFARVKPFILKQWEHLPLLAPNIVAGFLGEMVQLAEKASQGCLDTSSIDHALIVLTRCGSKPLTDPTRVMLWQTFGVPIFELYLGLDHSLLASECEAHEGWHTASGVGFVTLDATGELILDGAGNTGLRTGIRASIDSATCPCGRTSPRIRELDQPQGSDARSLAVSA
jgi:hypothetical protein